MLNFFKKRHYDMDTLDGINSIPVPAQNYHSGDFTKDYIYYLLQRKATEHKKTGRMDCAIACLRKSNELSDYEKRPLLTEKEYLRLVKYIELTGDHASALNELSKIQQRHPEFYDKRISNLPRISDTLKRCKTYHTDLVYLSTTNSCPICRIYNNKIFSISGKSKSFSKLPSEVKKDGGFCPKCIISLSPYFEGINSSPK